MDAAILAGGRASRLGGRDKGLLSVGRTPILCRQLAALDGVADRVYVIAGEPERFRRFRVRVFPDVLPDAGALGGLHAALSAAESRHVLVLACDLPFLTAPLLGHLASLADDACDVVVPRTPDGLQPLCAVYSRDLAPLVRQRVESGRLKIMDLLGAVRRREVGPDEVAAFDPDGRVFFNVNTPGDLKLAVRLAAVADRRIPG